MFSNQKIRDSFADTLSHLTTALIEMWAQGDVLKTEGTLFDKMAADALQSVAVELIEWRSGERITEHTASKLDELVEWQRGERVRPLTPDDAKELEEWRSGKRVLDHDGSVTVGETSSENMNQA